MVEEAFGLLNHDLEQGISIVQPIVLTPIQTEPGSPEFQAVLTWPFPVHLFYAAQVKRVLQFDIPQRFASGWGLIWIYKDPNGDVVGVGTLDLCAEYAQFTSQKVHPYIPVLAVHPQFQKRGHGRSIIEHLIGHAAVAIQNLPLASDRLFLDVYAANPATTLYTTCGFTTLNPNSPILDPNENNEPYFVMARNVAIATAPTGLGVP